MTPKTRPRFWASLWFRVSGGRVVRHRRGSGVTVVFEHVKLRCLLMLPLCYCLKPSFPYSSSSCSYSYDYDHLPLLLQLLLQLLQPSTTTTTPITTTIYYYYYCYSCGCCCCSRDLQSLLGLVVSACVLVVLWLVYTFADILLAVQLTRVKLLVLFACLRTVQHEVQSCTSYWRRLRAAVSRLRS